MLPLPASLAGLLVILVGGCRSTGPRDIGGVTVDIRGEEAVAEADIYDLAARELGDFARDRLRAAAASDAAFTMEHGLADRGYAHARVTFELLPSEEAPSELIFHVVEGPRAELGEVTFPGRRRIADEDIRALLVQRFQLSLRQDRWYRRSQIDEAVGQIEALYAMRGHHRVRVGPPVATWNEDRTEVDVAIPIREGRRFTVSRADVVPRDPEQPLPEELRTTLRSLGGAPFHRRLAADAAARVRGRLRELGYQFAEATGRWELDAGEGPPTATIVVEADAGVRQFVRSWNIAGLERSKPAFMESLIDLPGGDLVRQSVLNDAIDALYDTGAFGSVNITSQLVDEPGADGADGELRDLSFVVEEKDARSFEVGGGWGSYEQIRGWVGYRDRNFMGIARILDVVAHGSAKSLGVTSRVTDRYILGKDRTLSVGARL